MSNANPCQKILRQSRYSEAGLYYFLTIVTEGRRNFFLQPPAAEIVLEALKWLDQHGRIVLVAAAVMPDHLHFVAQLKDTTLSKLMHLLKSYTAKEINKDLSRRGPVWERQYYERGIRDQDSLIEIVKYCLENPVRKGLVGDFKKYPYWYCVYSV
jgi:REP element-mobilizing transposase RayT